MTRKRRNSYSSPAGSPPSETESMAAADTTSSREQDRLLPTANVSRIMKKSLPANAKVSKEAKETVQECVSEFISFITGEASDKCQREKRKTINGDDLLWAMTTLGFENYVSPLKIYLNKYRESEGEKTSMARQGDHDRDQSPTTDQESNGTNTITWHGANSSYNGGFYSVIPKSSGGGHTMGYHGDSARLVGFNMNEARENGGQCVAAQLNQVQW